MGSNETALPFWDWDEDAPFFSERYIVSYFDFSFQSSQKAYLRHFMWCKNDSSRGAAPDVYAPFYDNKVGHCIFVNCTKIDELR